MRRMKLDSIDRQILLELQENGRMTNVELSKKLGLSAPPCLRRVKTLEEQGYIRGYHANLNASAIGYKLTVFVMVSLLKHSEEAITGFKKLVDSWPQVRESYMVAGDFDFMLKVVAKNWDDYQNFLTSQLTAAPNLGHVKSIMSAGRTKKLPGVPVDLAEDESSGVISLNEEASE